jgi:hypothetical protein
MFLGARDAFTTAQDMAVATGRFVRGARKRLARLIGDGGPVPDGGAPTPTGVGRRPRRPKPARSRPGAAAVPHRKGKGRAIPDFRTDFAARRSRGEMVDTEQEIYRAGTPQDVTSVRAKSQRHRKSTADRWNQ